MRNGLSDSVKYWESEQMNLRIRRTGDVVFRLERAAEGKLHVRLSAANPDFAHQNVLQFDFVFAFDNQTVRAASVLPRQFHDPFAALRGRGNACAAKGHGHFFALIGPTPDRRAHSPLKNHVIGE